ncbi:MAG: DUF3363 domain-containing protein [Pseudomonadota bacterium]
MSKGGSDTPFEVKLGRINAPSGHTKVKSFFKKVGKRAQRFSGTRSKGRSSGNFQRQSAAHYHRRVVVKASIHKMAISGTATMRHHLNYIERDGAGKDGQDAELYTDETRDLDTAELLERSEGDRHHFRFIVSPEDAEQMSDLTSFTRELMAHMEKDLDTRLEWAAANHYDTDQPHVHIVMRGKRDDGKDLVIPRDYISKGLRERAQELVSLELGPVSELENRLRTQRMVEAERMTDIDRALIRRARDGQLDLSKPVPSGQVWRRRLEKARMGQLHKMGLAEPLGGSRWRLDKDAANALKRMGERGDIIKAMHRAMTDSGDPRLTTSASLFDPGDPNAKPITGKIIARGIADDVRDHAYVVIDATDGKAAYINIGPSDRLMDFEKGMIVTAHPASHSPRASDMTINDIAQKHGGIYSAAKHLEDAPRTSEEFIKAHVRRLEAMRKAGVSVARQSDGTWRIPPDFLDKAAAYEFETTRTKPVRLDMASRLDLGSMRSSIGATWLDEHLRDHSDNEGARGFSGEIEQARAARRAFLHREGVLKDVSDSITDKTLKELEKRDLQDAAKTIAARLGKDYSPAPLSGRISGKYVERLDRPSGRYGVIERAKDFSLVPWREVMDRNLGKQISGIIRGRQISWTLTRGRGIS